MNPTVWVDGIRMSVEESFGRMIEGMGDSISNAFNNAIQSTSGFILEGICIFIVYYMIFTAFKIMGGIDKEKQNKNFNTLGISAGLYMTVRMIAEVIARK